VFGLLALSSILLVFVVWGTLWVDKFLSIPPGSEQQVRVLFACAGVAFLINAMVSPFSTPAFSNNRLDVLNVLSILQTLARVSFVVFLFTWMRPQLWQIGGGLLISALVSAVGAIFIWRSLAPELLIRRQDAYWETFRTITRTSGWVFLVQVGGVLLLSIDIIVINRLLGPESSARYAAILQWSTMLRGLAGTIGGIFTPTLIAHFAREDMHALVADGNRAVKFLGIIVALPIGLICGFAGPLLTVWLGDDFGAFSLLMVLLVAPLSINLAITPLFAIALAKDQMKMPGIVQLVAGLLNLGLALLLCGPVGWGMYGVAAAGAIILTGKNLVFMPVFTARLVRQPWYMFYREMGTIMASTAMVGGLSYAITWCLHITNWLSLLASWVCVSLVYLGYIYCFALNANDRKNIARMGASLIRAV
jgi:membrane protein EpsK